MRICIVSITVLFSVPMVAASYAVAATTVTNDVIFTNPARSIHWKTGRSDEMRTLCGTIIAAAPWRSHRSAVIVPPADMKYPGTISVGRNGPEPMIVTIAGTAEKPIPYGVGGITLRLNYSDSGFGWGYRTEMDFSKGGRQEAKLTVFNSHVLNNVYAYYSAPEGVKLEPPRFEFFRPGGDAILDGVPVMALISSTVQPSM